MQNDAFFNLWLILYTVLKNAFCLEQCKTCTHAVSVSVQSSSAQELVGTISTAIHRSMLCSDRKCYPSWEALKKSLHMDYLTMKSWVFQYGNMKYIHFSLPHPNFGMFFYCTMEDHWQVFKDRSVPPSDTLESLWGYQILRLPFILRKGSDMRVTGLLSLQTLHFWQWNYNSEVSNFCKAWLNKSSCH